MRRCSARGLAVCDSCVTHPLVCCSLDLKDVRVVTKLGGTVDDSELVDGMVFDHKARMLILAPMHARLTPCTCSPAYGGPQ